MAASAEKKKGEQAIVVTSSVSKPTKVDKRFLCQLHLNVNKDDLVIWIMIFLSAIKLLTSRSLFNTLKRSLPTDEMPKVLSIFPFEISKLKDKLAFFLLSTACSSILLKVICCSSFMAFFSKILIAGKYFIQSATDFPSFINIRDLNSDWGLSKIVE
jgi:hypothetical protein